AYYYCAIIEDVILRFAWTIQISLSTITSTHSTGDIVATVLAPLEVFSSVWSSALSGATEMSRTARNSPQLF
ncbi:hypothetical protein CRUP_023713, partial [Coryphaenoides rupestris]